MINTNNTIGTAPPLIREVSSKIPIQTLQNQTGVVLNQIFSYVALQEFGRTLSTCKGLRFRINQNDVLWSDVAKRHNISEKYGRSWRDTVILLRDRTFFSETRFQYGSTHVSVNGSYKSEDGLTHLLTFFTAETWNLESNQKIRVFIPPKKEEDGILAFYDGMRAVMWSRHDKKVLVNKIQNQYQTNIQRSVTIIDNKHEILHQFYAKEYFGDIQLRGNKLISLDPYRTDIYDLPIERKILVQPRVIQGGGSLIKSILWSYRPNEVAMLNLLTDRSRTFQTPPNPTLKDMKMVGNILVQLTSTHLIGFKIDKKLLELDVEVSIELNVQVFEEIWRIEAQGLIIKESMDSSPLLALLKDEEGENSNLCTYYNALNGRKIGSRILQAGEKIFDVYFDSQLSISEKNSLVRKKYSPFKDKNIEKMEAEQIEMEKLEREKAAGLKPQSATPNSIVKITSFFSIVVRKIAIFAAVLFGASGVYVAFRYIKDGNLDEIRRLISRFTIWTRYPTSV